MLSSTSELADYGIMGSNGELDDILPDSKNVSSDDQYPSHYLYNRISQDSTVNKYGRDL